MCVGGSAVLKARDVWLKSLEDLVQLASLQTSVKTLDDALKVTNRRVNALEFVVMPLIYNTIKYVISELDELEREDQYRIKKVKDIRSQADDAEAAELAAEKKRMDELWDGVEEGRHYQQSRQATDEEKHEAKSMLQTKQYAVDSLLD